MKDGSVSPKGVVKNFISNSSVWAKIAIVLFFVLILIAIVLAVISTMNMKKEDDTHIDVSNFPEISNAPKEYQIGTEQLIWQLIEQNEPIPDFSDYQAIIREGSYHEETNNNISSADFIIDIEELRYSFEVSLSWPKGQKVYSDPSIKIRCPYYTDVIYTDTKCVAELPTAQIRRYLPHNYYLDNGYRVHIDENSTGGNFRLLVYINACKDENLIDSAMDYARNWIKTLYIDPDDFRMEAYDTCL